MNINFPIDDLEGIESRFRFKAQACRHRAKNSEDNIFASNSNLTLFNEGKEAGVQLWMCRNNYEPPADLELLMFLADWYDVAADAIVLLIEAAEQKTNLIAYLQLAGTVNAQLAAMIAAVHDNRDSDQFRLHDVVVDSAKSIGAFIPGLVVPKFSPTDEDLLKFLEQIDKGRKMLESASNTHLSLHLLNCAVKELPETEEEWTEVVDQISDLIAKGMKPSNAELRKSLLPIFEFIPTSVQSNSSLDAVMREIDLFLSTHPDVDSALDKDIATLDVPKVRQLLSGNRVLLIGGKQRFAPQKQLIDAFGLKDLVWLTSKPGQAAIPFTDDVLKKDYAAILLSLRFAGSLVDQAQGFCQRTHTPLVLLPAGYNRNQVAGQILSQCGGTVARRESA